MKRSLVVPLKVGEGDGAAPRPLFYVTAESRAIFCVVGARCSSGSVSSIRRAGAISRGNGSHIAA